MTRRSKKPRIGTVKKSLAEYFNIAAEDLNLPNKKEPGREARMIGVFLSGYVGHSFEKIAAEFGYANAKVVSQRYHILESAFIGMSGPRYEAISETAHEIGLGYLFERDY